MSGVQPATAAADCPGGRLREPPADSGGATYRDQGGAAADDRHRSHRVTRSGERARGAPATGWLARPGAPVPALTEPGRGPDRRLQEEVETR